MRTIKPKCLSCNVKRAREEDYFCSDKCGATYAWATLSAGGTWACPKCGIVVVEPSGGPQECMECGYREPDEEE